MYQVQEAPSASHGLHVCGLALTTFVVWLGHALQWPSVEWQMTQ